MRIDQLPEQAHPLVLLLFPLPCTISLCLSHAGNFNDTTIADFLQGESALPIVKVAPLSAFLHFAIVYFIMGP